MVKISQKIVPCVWLKKTLRKQLSFMFRYFKNSKILKTSYYPKASEEVSSQKEGSVMTVRFTLEGQEFMVLNGGLPQDEEIRYQRIKKSVRRIGTFIFASLRAIFSNHNPLGSQNPKTMIIRNGNATSNTENCHSDHHCSWGVFQLSDFQKFTGITFLSTLRIHNNPVVSRLARYCKNGCRG